MNLTLESLVGTEIEPYIDQIAALRIAVFREFPYLYEGSLEYEQKYLGNLAKSPHSYVVLARHGDNVVGASTALPLTDAEDDFQKPFLQQGLDIERYYYFGESILLPPFRGQKVGRRFYGEREAQADFLAFPECCFCAVVRPDDHPLRPAGYRPLDVFWKRRGYKPIPEVVAEYSWPDVGQAESTPKPMQFWSKRI